MGRASGSGGTDMAIKLNIGDPKSKQTKQVELDENNSASLEGKKLGESFKGELVDMAGYEFTITGGSDAAGFPMRWDVEGKQRRKVLIGHGLGNRKRRKGMRLRRTVAGNTVGPTIVQLNVTVTKHGKQPLFEEPKAAAEESEAAESTDAKAKSKTDSKVAKSETKKSTDAEVSDKDEAKKPEKETTEEAPESKQDAATQDKGKESDDESNEKESKKDAESTESKESDAKESKEEAEQSDKAEK